LTQQIIDDARKHSIELLYNLEHKWASYLGHTVFNNCKVSLKRPMLLLSVFEEAGKVAESIGTFLSWTVSITRFPVVQHYVEGITKKTYVRYGPPDGERSMSGYLNNTLQMNICYIENIRPSKRKQSQGASPNAIHSLDAAHMMLIVNKANFHVTTVHDSFGCLLGDMSELYVIVRETFVDLYKAEPLYTLMKDINSDIKKVDIGNLDISLILDSEYAFA